MWSFCLGDIASLGFPTFRRLETLTEFTILLQKWNRTPFFTFYYKNGIELHFLHIFTKMEWIWSIG